MPRHKFLGFGLLLSFQEFTKFPHYTLLLYFCLISGRGNTVIGYLLVWLCMGVKEYGIYLLDVLNFLFLLLYQNANQNILFCIRGYKHAWYLCYHGILAPYVFFISFNAQIFFYLQVIPTIWFIY